jgi:hypothetical protein
MKKQLLLGSALMLALTTFSQNNRQKFEPNGILNMSEKLAAKFASANSPFENTNTNGKKGTDRILLSPEHGPEMKSSNSTSLISSPFYTISTSMNVFGMIVSSSKPLQYNRYIDAVSFIQRKPSSYSVSPAGDSNSGAILGFIGKNCGAQGQWDSTVIWADATNLARYPQGGLYSPNGNHNINNAYAVAMGPTTGGTGWIGSYYASKSLTNTAVKNAAGSDEQFFSHTTPFGSSTSPTMTKHYFPRYGFSQCDNGMVYSLGGLYDTYDGGTGQPGNFRGGLLAKGNFVSGAMVWTPDSMVPPTVTITTGGRQLFSQPYMAWNDAGTVGYVVFIGGKQGATGANFGWQPIVYKTTNSGNTWALVNGIDFNTPSTFDFVLNSMASVNSNPNLAIPFFNVGEGIDVTVDKNNKLHIVSTVVGTARNNADSMGYTWQFPKGSENMGWPYVNTAWPYIFDFIGDGSSPWTFKTIDSVGTEGPSATSGQPGFGSNPWANQSQTTPQSSDMRIQVSRTYDGEFILYSWAESDTTLTTGAVKWNEFPNVKCKAMRICDGAVSMDEYNVTSPSTGFNPRVRDKAYFHYMSRQARGGASTSGAATFTVPFTVSNNLTTNGDSPVDNFFGRSIVSFSFATAACGNTVTTNIKSNTSNEVDGSRLYPNPAKNNFNVAINLSKANEIAVDVYNTIGQKIAGARSNGTIGENTINMDLNNVTPGVFFVKIKAGTNESTKKLVIE